ncbi:MAG: hypothetical protein O3C57_03445 [Verrucomicrobia bacterium]|nr:hypothetical protein [Verrucomicrobiota bacterium]
MLIASSSVDFVASRYLSPGALARPVLRRGIPGLAITTNLAALLYFKFMNFFVAQANQILGYADVTPIAWQDVLLPFIQKTTLSLSSRAGP